MTPILLALCQSALAQGIIIDVPGSADIPMAVPKPQLPATEPAALAEEIWSVVFHDLEFSGYFEMQNPSGYVEKGKGVEPGQFDMNAWTLIKTTVLVKTRVYPAGHAACDPGGSKMCADVYVYYVPGSQKLASKRFRSTAEGARQLGHAIANQVLLATTGSPGVFGSRLAAVGTKTGNKEIYLMDLDGHGVTPVTRNGAINLSPAWSPDGSQIAWTSYKKANPDLYVKDLGTGRTRTISNVKGVNTSPDFSPDGTKLALARSVEGDSDVFLVDARTGTEIRRLTSGGGIDVSPDFVPGGADIVFASERSGGSQIYRMPVGGGEATRLTFAGDFNVDPVVSPDGTKVAYVSRSPSGFDVLVADLETKNVTRITQDMGDNEDPTWSPDSKYVVFSSTRTGRSELWISTADGRHQSRLTESGGWTQPAWAPAAP
ncbi:MAG: Tol-Pal system beta propeller repeat protein TolB [Alphaproteobacteria bacterium]|nr:Tol-Pal system beta propeller repeat protein TolB [Alphaproteobacteria bacterium]MCB9697874.1 Tol-Pal system beta propeller repeat protein TolB [Alphaproteobacteria bacterium]